jgi:oxygen-independent coproporphyrinogen III oxidase
MPLGLYLHFPFCRHKCAYCDFYKERYEASLEERFYAALRIETELAAESLRDHDTHIATLYTGGGTPSLTSIEPFRIWLEQVRKLFGSNGSIEFSFEINPESCSRELLQALQELGVTRPVFGIQSFDQKLLKLLSRKHELRQVHEAVYLANALGFDSYGCDLLYAMPGQTGKMLSSDLDQLTDLDPPHISFYQLTVEEGTELDRMVQRGTIKLPDQDFAQALYSAGYEHFKDHGYERYEVCSFAKPDSVIRGQQTFSSAPCDTVHHPLGGIGRDRESDTVPNPLGGIGREPHPRGGSPDEALTIPAHACRHNMNYWTGGEYLGLGPAAHSFLDGRRFSNVANLYEYMEALEKGRRPMIDDHSGEKERIFEAIMLGLRTAQGIDRISFERRFHRPLIDAIDSRQHEMLLNSGHLVDAGDFLRLSDEALILADEITQRLTK